MNELVKIWRKPATGRAYMIAGWRQWADAGNVSSGLPRYLIEHTNAVKIGEIKSEDFYLFQIPGTHHFLRPEVKLKDGYVEELEQKKNEFYLTSSSGKDLVVFLGDEPHLHVERYANAFLTAVEALDVQRVVCVGGVYGAMPYDKDREVSCAFSLKGLKEELTRYAVRFSDYEGGSTIGTYLVRQARERGLELIVFYAFVPAYDLSELSTQFQGMRIDNDFRAWYELMRRLNHMFDLRLDLTELEEKSEELVASMAAQISELDKRLPQLNVKAYIERLTEDFTERPFMPLDDMWEEELGDLLEGFDEQ